MLTYNYKYIIIIVVLILIKIDNIKLDGEIKVKYTTKEDNIEIIDSNSFEENIYNSNRATFLQFYAYWCSSCQRTAPHFKKLAKVLKPWNNLLRTAVLDCGLDVNGPLCDEHGIEFVPTFKLFYAYTKDIGLETGGDNFSQEDFIRDIVDFIEDHPTKPKHWPALKPLTITLDRLFTLNKRLRYALLVFEEEKSYVARKLILDFSKFAAKFCIRRVIKSKNSKLFGDLKVNTNELPVFYLIQRNDATKGFNNYSFDQVVKNMKTEEEYNIITLNYNDETKKDLRYTYGEMIAKFIRYTALDTHVDLEL